MGRNGKKRQNPGFSSVAATLEKAITYIFAESPFRNAEVRGSIPLCSTNKPSTTHKPVSQQTTAQFFNTAAFTIAPHSVAMELSVLRTD